jgi:hypothetical protein
MASPVWSGSNERSKTGHAMPGLMGAQLELGGLNEQLPVWRQVRARGAGR